MILLVLLGGDVYRSSDAFENKCKITSELETTVCYPKVSYQLWKCSSCDAALAARRFLNVVSELTKARDSTGLC